MYVRLYTEPVFKTALTARGIKRYKLAVNKMSNRDEMYSLGNAVNDYAKAFDCVDHNKLWKILKEMGIPDHLLEKPIRRSGSNS